MNAPYNFDKPDQPLQILSAEPMDVGDLMHTTPALCLTFNRQLTDLELRMYRELPATPAMLNDTTVYIERMQLAELVVCIFRAYVLGGVVIPETPRVMAWLKSWIDGKGHGPVGGPLLWPESLPFVCQLIANKGFARTPGKVGYVARALKQPPRPGES